MTSILFNPYKKVLDSEPVKPIAKELLNRHGRLGLDGALRFDMALPEILQCVEFGRASSRIIVCQAWNTEVRV